jgi:hypothetical protein
MGVLQKYRPYLIKYFYDDQHKLLYSYDVLNNKNKRYVPDTKCWVESSDWNFQKALTPITEEQLSLLKLYE